MKATVMPSTGLLLSATAAEASVSAMHSTRIIARIFFMVGFLLFFYYLKGRRTTSHEMRFVRRRPTF